MAFLAPGAGIHQAFRFTPSEVVSATSSKASFTCAGDSQYTWCCTVQFTLGLNTMPENTQQATAVTSTKTPVSTASAIFNRIFIAAV